MVGCYTCELTARRDAGAAPVWDSIWRTDYWDVAHSFNTSLPGWLVLVARRHVAAVAELSEAESTELGRLIRQVSMALQEVTGCLKTYVVQFAEHPDHPHVHVHVIPRMANFTETERGPDVFSLAGVPPEQRLGEEEMNDLALRIRGALNSQISNL